MTRRKHLPHGTLVGIDQEVKRLWFQRDLEPELLSGKPVPDIPDESDPLRDRDARILFNWAMSMTAPQEQLVLNLRFLEELTLREIAEKMGVTKERIRQIEAKAMRRIRMRSARESHKTVRSFFA